MIGASGDDLGRRTIHFRGMHWNDCYRIGTSVTETRAMPNRNFLAFDLGAESGRAVLGRLSAGKLTLEEKHRFPNPNGRINGHLQWNLLGQWEELKTGLRKTMEA